MKLIVSEAASSGDRFYSHLSTFKPDAKLWNSLAGMASHFYNMSATDKAASYIAGTHIDSFDMMKLEEGTLKTMYIILSASVFRVPRYPRLLIGALRDARSHVFKDASNRKSCSKT